MARFGGEGGKEKSIRKLAWAFVVKFFFWIRTITTNENNPLGCSFSYLLVFRILLLLIYRVINFFSGGRGWGVRGGGEKWDEGWGGRARRGWGNGWKKILFLHFFFRCRNFWLESFCFYWKVATKEKKFFMRFNARI